MTTIELEATAEETITVKIANLLRHAEKASTAAEADAYLSKAQLLSTRYQIDLEVAKAHGQLRIPKLEQKMIQLGRRGKRGLGTYVSLFSAIGDANDVKIDIFGNGAGVLAFGYDTDIEIVEALYGSLIVQMVTASDAFIRSGAHRADTVWSESRWDEVPISGITARINFQEAFARAVRSRLTEARAEAIAQTQAEQDAHFAAAIADGSNAERQQGAELVLHTKASKVQDYHKAESRARGTYGGSRTKGHSRTAASAGRTAGQNARLGGKAVGGHRKAIG